ncbi:MAG: UDP-3-O-(3-hydroxymyristoyl)glucosamine N-acyltransferase [Flavobacteriales bacterium]|nr:UDP-3-O-(3-hydroxymyristoyl)glucosamine N-acyltransferase [Flavobacteriales bacterium]
MEYTALQIAGFINGSVEGDEQAKVNAICRIEEGRQGALSFLGNLKYEEFIYNTEASIVLVNQDFKPAAPIKSTLIRVPNAYEAFTALLKAIDNRPKRSGVEASSFVHPSVQIPENVYIGAFAYISEGVVLGKGTQIYPHCYIGDGTQIGENCTLFSGVKVYHNCQIGNSVTLHSGVVIGADGFGFSNQESGFDKVPQIGNVILEDNVEIGANTTVDRATIGSTIIRKGVKLDNLIMIGHNVEVGEHTVMAAQVGIAGSTKIGKKCMFGGQVGVAGHITVAENSIIGAQAGVNSSIRKPDGIWLGGPAMEIGGFRKSAILFKNLPQMEQRLRDLERKAKGE